MQYSMPQYIFFCKRFVLPQLMKIRIHHEIHMPYPGTEYEAEPT